MLLVHVPWADRIMALPFFTVLAPSKRFYADKLRSPKTLVDWARQAALQIRRWLPGRYIVLVADSAFAAIEFLAAVRKHVCVVTRLRLDANLFAFPSPKRKGRGRPAIKGKRLRKLSAVLKDPKVQWQRCRISLWYGRTNRLVEITSGTALWYRAELRPCRSAGSSSATPMANSIPRDSWPQILTPTPEISWPGSCAAGRSRSHLKKFARTAGSKLSASGPTKRSCVLPPPCSACSLSSLCSRTSSQSRANLRSEPPRGIQKPSRPSATLSRRCAAKYGRIRFLSCRGRAETASKFRSISGIACRTRSHTPPRSAKVKLRVSRHGRAATISCTSRSQVLP